MTHLGAIPRRMSRANDVLMLTGPSEAWKRSGQESKDQLLLDQSHVSAACSR